MNFNNVMHSKGKIVYFIDGHRFENSAGARDGRAKAEAYCLDNFLNPADIQKFDSRTECSRYEYLLERLRIGEIKNLAHHFTIKIQDEFVNANGDTIPALTYEADFIYQEADGRRVVEDVKGSTYFIDERFMTIKQVFDCQMAQKGLYIRVILLRNGERIEWRIGEQKKSQKLIKKQRELLKAYKEEEHKREMLERASTREKARYIQLRDMINAGIKLTSAQRKRFDALKTKFEI